MDNDDRMWNCSVSLSGPFHLRVKEAEAQEEGWPSSLSLLGLAAKSLWFDHNSCRTWLYPLEGGVEVKPGGQSSLPPALNPRSEHPTPRDE